MVSVVQTGEDQWEEKLYPDGSESAEWTLDKDSSWATTITYGAKQQLESNSQTERQD